MKNLTEEEILPYVKEFVNFIKIDLKLTDKDKIIKEKFLNIVKSQDKNNFITKINFHTGPSLEWLKKKKIAFCYKINMCL